MEEIYITKDNIRQRFQRCIYSYNDNAKIQKLIVEKLSQLLQCYNLKSDIKVLEIGCGTGFLTQKIVEQISSESLYINDLVHEMCYETAYKYNVNTTHCLPGDIEILSFKDRFDFILSASTFQWFQHPFSTYQKLADCLSTEGIMIFNTFGIKNFIEIKTVTGKGLHYLENQYLIKMLNNFFDILYFSEATYILEFNEPLKILEHLKKTGVNASSSHEIWTKGKIESFSTKYKDFFRKNGKCPLTYHPLYFVCKKKQVL